MHSLFPIPLREFYGTDKEINNKIIPLVYSHIKKVESTLSDSDRNKFDSSINGHTSYYGPDLTTVPEFEFWLQYLWKCLYNEMQKNLGIQMTWFTIYGDGHFIPRHTHAMSEWSGVYYVKAEKNCGDLTFFDPIGDLRNHYSNDHNLAYSVEPQENMFLVFPSWLAHESKPNKSGTDRIIFSFNFMTENPNAN